MRRNCQRKILTSRVPCDPGSQILCWLVLRPRGEERMRGEREGERATKKEMGREMGRERKREREKE